MSDAHGTFGGVYSRGERRDPPKKKNDEEKAYLPGGDKKGDIEKGLDNAAKEIDKGISNMMKFFTPKDKQWKKKGEGHTLAGASAGPSSSGSSAAVTQRRSCSLPRHSDE